MALRYATLRYATLRYATLRYATLRYATLRHLFLGLSFCLLLWQLTLFLEPAFLILPPYVCVVKNWTQLKMRYLKRLGAVIRQLGAVNQAEE